MAEVADAVVTLMPSFRGGRAAIERELGGSLDGAGRSGGQRFGSGMQTGIAGMAGKMFAPLAAAAASVSLVGFFKDAIGGASDLNESTTKINAIFGDAAGAVQDFAGTGAQALGQTKLAVLDAAATFGTFGKSAGLAGPDLASFSTGLSTLSTDLSSFYNTTPQAASDALGAALRGEFEPMRQYGVLLDEATLKAEAMKLGLISTTTEALTPQQKVLAAQSAILAQTGDAQGDFARTSGGLANQQRILSAQFDDFKTKIGTALLPVITSLVSYLTANLFPALSLAGGYLKDTFGPALQAFGGFLRATVLPGLATFGAFVSANIVPALASLGAYITTTVVPAFMQLVGFVQTQVIPVVTKLAQFFMSTILPALQLVGGFIVGTVVPALVSIAETVAANVLPILQALWTQFKTNILPALMEVYTVIADRVVPVLVRVGEAVVPVIKFVVELAAKILGTVIPVIINFAGPVLGKIISVLGTVIGWIANAIGAVVNFGVSVYNAGAKVVEFAGTVGTKIGEAVGFVLGLPGKVTEALANFGTLLLQKGRDLIQGLINGITEKIQGIKDAMSNVTDAIADFLPGSPIRVGPLKSWNRGGAGKRLVGLLAEGIDASSLTGPMARLTSGLTVPSMGANLAVAGAAPGVSAGGRIVIQNMHVRDEAEVVRRLRAMEYDDAVRYNLAGVSG